jgi:metal-sulfur cluster biosynthetic enzyme
MPLSVWFLMAASRSSSPDAEGENSLSLSCSPVSTFCLSTESPMPSPDTIRKAIRAVKDPELNLNIIDIGLVYDVETDEQGDVRIQMTLTSPGCPSGAEIIDDVKRVVRDVEGVRSVEVELVWDPYWTPEKMDPRVRTFLGF